MANSYSVEFLDSLTRDPSPIIVELNYGGVYVGILTVGYGNGHYHLRSLTINDGGIGFTRSMIKRIVYFNGLIVPKDEGGKHNILDIFELNELVNKAGYEFM